MPNLAGTASAAESTWVFVAPSVLCCLDHELYLQMFLQCGAVRIWKVSPAKDPSAAAVVLHFQGNTGKGL